MSHSFSAQSTMGDRGTGARGEEVTGQKQYYNAQLSRKPFKDW